MSTADHAAAWVALLNTGGAHAYALDDVPVQRPAFYTEVHVIPGQRRNERAGSQGALLSYRLILRHVGNLAHNAGNERDKAVAAVDERTITVSGVASTDLRRETWDEPVTPDGNSTDAWHSATTSWLYTL